MTTSITTIPESVSVEFEFDQSSSVELDSIDVNSDIEFETCLEIEVNGNSTSVDTTIEVSSYDVEQAVGDELSSVTVNISPAEFVLKVLKQVRDEIDRERGWAKYKELRAASKDPLKFKTPKQVDELDPIDDKLFSAVVAKMLEPVVKVAPKLGVEVEDDFTPAPDEYY